MTKFLYILLAALIFLLQSCAEENKPVSNNPGSYENAATKSEPVMKVKKEVIFFAPSSTELAARIDNEPGLDESMSDFDFYVNEFMNNPGRADLVIRYEDEASLNFKLADNSIIQFQRAQQPQACGIILFNGTAEPKVLPGVMTDGEIRKSVDDFFGKP